MGRLLALGIDAAPGGLVDELIADGHLPHLARLTRGARRAVVTNVPDYRAELPWTGFWSARTPAENRYWGTVRFDPADYAVAEAGALRAEPFFARLERPVLVVDLPHCAPWPGVVGIQVAAWGAHSPQVPRSSQPAGLVTKLDRLVGPHPAFETDSQPGWHSPLYLDALVDALVVGASRRAEAVRWLAGQVPDWGLALVVFSETHSAGHHLWHGIDAEHPLHRIGERTSASGGERTGASGGERTTACKAAFEARRRLVRVYAAVDAAIGRLLALADAEPDTTVAVFSVHGTRTNANDLPALYLVPELLHRLHGHPSRLSRGWGRPERPHRVPSARAAVGDLLAAQLDIAAPERTRLALRRARHRLDPRCPPWYRLSDRQWGEDPPDSELGHRPLHYLGTELYRPWWPHQRIFALPSFSDTHLRLNLRTRERSGQVEPADYARELDRWEAELAACRDPRSGTPVSFHASRPARSRADDPDGAPADLVVRFDDPLDALDHPRAGRIGPVPFLRTGEHDPDGFLLLRTPDGAAELPERLPVEALGPLLVNLPGIGAHP